MERAEKAKKDIVEATSNDQVSILLADMAELSQVRKIVSDLQEKESQVDVLVCNAGALFNERRESSEGREITFASHLLGGSYLLSKLLVPQLKAAKEGRVVYVSSGGMYNTKFVEWDIATNSKKSSQKYDGQFAYAYAKRGQVLLAEELTKTTPEVAFVSAHPGWSSTPAVDDAYGESKKYLEPMRSTWQGAEGIAWLMATDKSNIHGGEFYLDRKPRTKHLAGAFMSEGSFTKNTQGEIDEMMAKLKEAAGL
jgi:dehydrogenase/reductase SDR family protein 12